VDGKDHGIRWRLEMAAKVVVPARDMKSWFYVKGDPAAVKYKTINDVVNALGIPERRYWYHPESDSFLTTVGEPDVDTELECVEMMRGEWELRKKAKCPYCGSGWLCTGDCLEADEL